MIDLISPNFQDIESLFKMSDYYKVQNLVQSVCAVVICWFIAKNNDNHMEIMIKAKIRKVDNWSL
jgi:hypothetical protein